MADTKDAKSVDKKAAWSVDWSVVSMDASSVEMMVATWVGPRVEM